MRHRLFGALPAIALVASVGTAHAGIVLVDFGLSGSTTASPDVNGNHWNNFTPGAFLNLVNTDSTPAGFNLGASTNVSVNNPGALTAPSAWLLGDLAISSATGDYAFTSGAALTFVLSSLDPSKTYDLRMFGTRATDGTRITQYTATGGDGPASVQLQTSGVGIGDDGVYNGNDDEIVSLSGIAPTPGGEITLDVSVITGGFAYLGVLEITEVPTPASALALLGLGAASLRRRR
ncbi:MAG: hypothetical protein Tsb0013_03360 [Phycisphaerales bacterium]